VGKNLYSISDSYATNGGSSGSVSLVGGGSGTTTGGGMAPNLDNLSSTTTTWSWNTTSWNNGYTNVSTDPWLNLSNAAPVLIPDMPMDTITANTGSRTYNGTTSSGLGVTQVVTPGGSSLSSSITTNPPSSPNVGSYTITPSGTTPSAPTSQSSLGGVTFVNGTLTITPATLLASTTASKVYNGTPWLSLTGSDTTFTGVDGQTATLNAPRTETLNSSNVGSILGGTLSVTGSDLIGSTGFSYSNYILPTAFTGGAITPAPLTFSGSVSNPTKVYDGTTTATLTQSNSSAVLSGFVSGQDATYTGASGTYAQSNVGTGIDVSATLGTGNFSSTGTGFSWSNYSLSNSMTISGTGTITPASTNISGGTTPTTSGGTSTTRVPPPIDGLSSMETSLPFGSSVSNLNMSSTPPSSASGSGVVASLPETVSSSLDGNLLDVEDLSK